MYLKLRNIFLVLITTLFCMNALHADSEITKKNKNHLFRLQKSSKKQKSKNKKLYSQNNKKFVGAEKKFKRSSKNLEYKILPVDKPIEIDKVALNCDSTFTDLEVENSILKSNYGSKMLQNLKNIFESAKNIYLDTLCDLDCDVKLCLDDFFSFFR